MSIKYTIKTGLVALLATTLALSSCQREQFFSPEADQKAETEKAFDASKILIPGEAFVKLTPEGLRSLSDVGSSLRSISSLRAVGSDLEMVPVFEIGGAYERAQRLAGLDRWYKATFDQDADVQAVVAELNANPSVEKAHGSVPLFEPTTKFVPVKESALRADVSEFSPANGGYPAFESVDPLLKYQWHYQNDGIISNFRQGADIGLFDAWKVQTGNKDVIVAVIDSGIDESHPDLEGALWRGKDGAIGRNFYALDAPINPGYHGTHVAGTIGARNNNGKGVAGVAGGDGTPESGVRVMSCQIFGGDNEGGRGARLENIAKAFPWAAENGAVLINCSWGFPWKDNQSAQEYLELYEKSMGVIDEAVSYFAKTAGNEPDGSGRKRADSPMSGGIVFFASGNDSAIDIPIIPAKSKNVIAVAAYTADFSRASYANLGTWVDILAPGGIVTPHIRTGILSTVPATFINHREKGLIGADYMFPGHDNLYAFAQGTSMATPHMTGVAALIVSQYGGKGKQFTTNDLEERIFTALKNVSPEQENPSPNLVGRMGVGYIDAGLAMGAQETVAPTAVQLQVKDFNYYDAKVSWAVTKDEDSPNKTTFEYLVYLSETPFVKAQTSSLRAIGGDIRRGAVTTDGYTFENAVAVVRSGKKSEGAEVVQAFENLEAGKTYYVAVVSRDRNKNVSAPAFVDFTTRQNQSPRLTSTVLEDLNTKLIMLDTESHIYFPIQVTDGDGHKWSHQISALPRGVEVVRKGQMLHVTILPEEPVGDYTFTITVTDEMGGKTVQPIRFGIRSHAAPEFVGTIHDLSLRQGNKAVSIDLSQLVKLAGQEQARFEVKASDASIVDVKVEGGKLLVAPKGVGMATVTLIVRDSKFEARTTFDVVVTDTKMGDLYALYPSPAQSFVTLLMRDGVKTVDVTVTSVRGTVFMNKTLTVNDATNEATLEIGALVPGLYTLIIKTEGSTVRRNIIKN